MRSQTQRVEPGQVVQRNDFRLRASGEKTKAPKSFASINQSGWITYSEWDGAIPVQSFASTWVVPPAPATQGQQLLYLFNSLMNADDTVILQPVLQWGVSAAGGGPYWSVASWYVPNAGQTYVTPAVRVEPGQTLVGLLNMTGFDTNTGYAYASEFQGMPATKLQLSGLEPLPTITETLEAYSVNSCSDYPSGSVSFTNISLGLAGGSIPNLAWKATAAQPACGARTTIGSNSANAGRVQLFFGP